MSVAEGDIMEEIRDAVQVGKGRVGGCHGEGHGGRMGGAGVQ